MIGDHIAHDGEVLVVIASLVDSDASRYSNEMEVSLRLAMHERRLLELERSRLPVIVDRREMVRLLVFERQTKNGWWKA